MIMAREIYEVLNKINTVLLGRSSFEMDERGVFSIRIYWHKLDYSFMKDFTSLELGNLAANEMAGIFIKEALSAKRRRIKNQMIDNIKA